MASKSSPSQRENAPPQSSNAASQPNAEPKAEIVVRRHQICPYLGLRTDRTVVAMSPTPAHGCYARKRLHRPTPAHQFSYCLGPNYPTCSIYPDRQPGEARPADAYTLQDEVSGSRLRWGRWFSSAAALVLVAAVAFVFAAGVVPLPSVALVQGLLPLQATPQATSAATLTVTLDTVVGEEVPPAVETPTPAASVDNELPVDAPPVTTPAFSAPDTEAQAAPPAQAESEMTLTPSRDDVGWWASGESQPGQIGDSFLYAGVLEGHAYVSAVRFDLRRVPRGAEILEGRLRLTGLRSDRLDSNGPSSWLVQLLSESTLPEWPGVTFFSLYEAPVSFSLSPEVDSTSVGEQIVNEWVLDSAARGWLFQQLLNGASRVVVRIVPVTNNGNSLFAWDSGHGSQSRGAAPELFFHLGPVPPTPPPTATRPQLVATLSPTPENVMTVVILTPAAPAQVAPTGTPVPAEIVTPTPVAVDLPAVQTAAIAEGRPPVLLNTPVPANEETATAVAAYATAVALTTGTFTPVPENYVTPVLFFPSPPAENVATAAVRSQMATAQAQSGTPTPTRNPNAVDAIYVFATDTPANAETAVALIVEQNSMAMTTGTPTPTPWNLVVITSVPQPTPTPIPLFIPTSQLTPTATPSPTRMLTAQDMESFRNMILFLSDREGGTSTWVMNPATGEVIGKLTDPRMHSEARTRYLAVAPDGKQQAIVQEDSGTQLLQIKLENFEYATIQQLTHVERGIAYDPAWSPQGNLIAFVGTQSGGDEIYTIEVTGGEPVRLTSNTWEWDKHPTWSPDGSQIAFYSNRETGRRQIWIMNADGSNQRSASPSEFEDWDPVWIR